MVFTPALPLIPLPRKMTAGRGSVAITTGTEVSGDEEAVALVIEGVARRTGITLAPTNDAVISLRVDGAALPPEGYTLHADERIEVVGGSSSGLFYGVQTLMQLLRRDDAGWGVLRATISDAPRFAHRGVMLDVARHFFGVSDVRRLIDAASALKFNRLHLHLSDDQGWRIQIDSWPRLTSLASGTSVGGGSGGFYTKDDYRAIVAYASARHMTVIPEIDLPGHTHAVGIAYPDLVEEPVISELLRAEAAQLGQALPVAQEPYVGWGVGHSSVRIRSERTYDFVRDVIRELAELTPGPYIHIGGDEALGTAAADFAHFVDRASEIVIEHGRVPITWHEAGASEGLAAATVGQYWGMTTPDGSQRAHAARFVERGGLIMSPADAAYLDMKPSMDFPLGLTWAGVTDLRAAYEWEPTAVIGAPESALIGVEAPLWTETVPSMDDAERLLFPRAAAIAEIAWSPRAGEHRDFESFRTRVGALGAFWDDAGVLFDHVSDVDWSDR